MKLSEANHYLITLQKKKLNNNSDILELKQNLINEYLRNDNETELSFKLVDQGYAYTLKNTNGLIPTQKRLEFSVSNNSINGVWYMQSNDNGETWGSTHTAGNSAELVNRNYVDSNMRLLAKELGMEESRIMKLFPESKE